MKKNISLFIAFFVVLTSLSPAAADIKEIPLGQVRYALTREPQPHPRLFCNDSQLPAAMKKINSSNELKALHEATLQLADGLIDRKPLQRKMTGRRLLGVSRDALKRLLALSWAYRSTGEEKYLKRAEQEMLALAAFTDWNPSHFLDVAEMTTAMAIGYDWLYNDLAEKSRDAIRQAIVEKGIRPSLYENKKAGWWINGTNNWNQVCHGGIACGALAIAEDDPALAETIIHRSVNKVQIAMNEYEPHGAYPEGPGYWVYGTTYNVLLLAALDSVLGTDFGLSEKSGFAKCPEYFLHVTGPIGLYFNYPDSGSRSSFIPAVFWFAQKYNNPSLTWNQQKVWKEAIRQKPSDLTRNRTSVLALLWATPETATPKKVSWMGQGTNPVAMFRSSWDSDATYLGIKGGTPSSNHAHMDIGSFVIDAGGLRWAVDLGPESYNKIEQLGMGLWNGKQDGERWKIFRYNNFSHNTLTVNDQLQQVKGFAPIIRYSDAPAFAHAVVDMTDVYKGQLQNAIRGAALLETGQVVIQDEIKAADTGATVRWAMATPAKVDIQSDKTAILSQKQKTMRFDVVTDTDVKLATYSTKPRADYDADNGDTRMIGFEIELAAGQEVRLTILMTPEAKSKPAVPAIKPCLDWSKPLD